MNAEKKNFYGWILLVAIGIMFLCSSGFILVGASVVNPLMMADSSMNMNATLMGLGFTLFVLCQGIPAPLIGQFITKYGQKKTFIVGGLLLIIGGLLMAFVVKTTIGYLIAFGVILSIGSQMAGQVTMQTSVSAWFVQKRALAMSIATVIGAIGSFISPRILNSIVASTGRWQDAWLLVAGLGVVVIIIAVALVVDKPSDKGQYPDGIEPGSAVAAAQKFSRVYKTSEVYDHKAVLKNRNFWFIALAATGAFCLYSLNSAAAVKHFTTQGFESAAIVAAVSYMGIANMVGKLSVGPIGDKVESLPKYKELAKLLGGKLAGTRPVCDRELLPVKLQVGQSGVMIKPKLYIGFGVSGAVNHVTGVDAEKFIAVNKDASAPIFNYCDYGIVGDMDEVCDAMIAMLKN